MGKIIKFRKKEVEDITTKEFFGEEVIPFVDGGIYYLDISNEGFNRPYIALPDNQTLMKYDYMNLKKFIRVTSNQYSFFDIPIGTSGNCVSFAATHELIGIQNKEFKKTAKTETGGSAISPWIYPSYKVHPMIMNFLMRVIRRSEISDPEEYVDLIDEIYRYCKHIESLHLPLYTKRNHTSMIFNMHPNQKIYYKFQFDNMDKPEMMSYILEGFGDGPKLIIPETVQPQKEEPKEEPPAPGLKPKGNGSFEKSFAEKVQEAFAETNSSSTEDKIKEVLAEQDTKEQKEDLTPERETTVEDLPPDVVVPMKIIQEKDLGTVTDTTCLPSRYLPEKLTKKSNGPVDPELVKRLPEPGVSVHLLNKDQMLAFVEAYETYKTTVLMAAMGYSASSRKTVAQRYENVKKELAKFDTEETQDTLPVKESTEEIERKLDGMSGRSDVVMPVEKTDKMDDCEDLRSFIDLEEIERHLNMKTGNPSVDGVSSKFSLSRMRYFMEMDKSNNSNGIMAVFNLKSRSQVIRLRGKILNELDARKENATIVSIPHRTDFFTIEHKVAGNDNVYVSAVGAHVFLTDAAKYPISIMCIAYNIDQVEFSNRFAFCLEIYKKNKQK